MDKNLNKKLPKAPSTELNTTNRESSSKSSSSSATTEISSSSAVPSFAPVSRSSSSSSLVSNATTSAQASNNVFSGELGSGTQSSIMSREMKPPLKKQKKENESRPQMDMQNLNELLTIDKHALTVRIFNFYKETRDRFPSKCQQENHEVLLNRLILQCIGTSCRPANWVKAKRPYVNPYTPIKISQVDVSELNDDCVALLVEQFKSFQELVEKALVFSEWVEPVAKVISGRVHSLKMFDAEAFVDMYQEAALMQYNLARLDPVVCVQQIGDSKDDRILVQKLIRDDIKNEFKDIIKILFKKVTHLVLHTQNINQTKLIGCMDELTSITLFEPPDSRNQHRAIWEALNAASQLRHVHIFYCNCELSLVADRMDFLTRIESFTLDNYTADNLSDILARLNPQLRCLQIGPLAKGDRVLEQLIERNREMVANLTQLSVRLDEEGMVKAQHILPYGPCYQMHKKMLQLIVENFRELTYLDLDFASLLFYSEVIGSVSQLHKLTELRFANRPDSSSGFLEWPTDNQFEQLGTNMPREPQPLPNIRKVYLALNDQTVDYHFLYRLFPNDGSGKPNIFPNIEQVTFVLNEDTFNEGGWDYLSDFRISMLRIIPPQYWLRLRLHNVKQGPINERFFARDQQEVNGKVRALANIAARRRELALLQDEIRVPGDDDDDDDDGDDEGEPVQVENPLPEHPQQEPQPPNVPQQEPGPLNLRIVRQPSPPPPNRRQRNNRVFYFRRTNG